MAGLTGSSFQDTQAAGWRFIATPWGSYCPSSLLGFQTWELTCLATKVTKNARAFLLPGGLSRHKAYFSHFNTAVEMGKECELHREPLVFQELAVTKPASEDSGSRIQIGAQTPSSRNSMFTAVGLLGALKILLSNL